MKTYLTLILLSLLTSEFYAQNVAFKHDWDLKYREHELQFTSNRKAPIPFSMSGEPQAIMYVGAWEINSSEQKDLKTIVSSEIEGIRRDLCIEEYLEEDYKANDHIVTYFDIIDNVQYAVIKYRTNGTKSGQKTMPRSTRQILFIYNGKLYISSLIVLYAEDQDNMRSDQMTFIKAILTKK